MMMDAVAVSFSRFRNADSYTNHTGFINIRKGFVIFQKGFVIFQKGFEFSRKNL
jgi:hypothetical protein